MSKVNAATSKIENNEEPHYFGHVLSANDKNPKSRQRFEKLCGKICQHLKKPTSFAREHVYNQN